MNKKEERIQQEMAWLRCINFEDEKDVRRAALEIINSVDYSTIH